MNQKKKQAADNGLDPESVNTLISTKWAKMTMVATGISCDVSFTTKKLQIKTEARFKSENSVMSG